MITTFVDPFDEKELEGAIREKTKAVFLETLGNPNSDVVDIEEMCIRDSPGADGLSDDGAEYL